MLCVILLLWALFSMKHDTTVCHADKWLNPSHWPWKLLRFVCCGYRLIVLTLMTALQLSHPPYSKLRVDSAEGLWHSQLDEGLEKDKITQQPCSFKGRLSQCGGICVGGRVCRRIIDNDSCFMFFFFFEFVLPGNHNHWQCPLYMQGSYLNGFRVID